MFEDDWLSRSLDYGVCEVNVKSEIYLVFAIVFLFSQSSLIFYNREK